MRKILLLSIFISILSFGQNKDELLFKPEYSVVEEIDLKKDLLYGYSKAWFSNSFKSGESVIDMEDKESGRIIGKAAITKRVNSTFGNQVGYDLIRFQITIDVKDNKYRMVINNFDHGYVQTATINTGNAFSDAIGKSMTRKGGSLSNEKPDCGGMQMSKKQWRDIKNFSHESAQLLISNLKEYLENNKNNDF